MPVNVFAPGGTHDERHGVRVYGRKINGETPANPLPYPIVRYTWTLRKDDEFCGIVGVWYGPTEVSLRPTSQTDHSGEYTDNTSLNSSNGLHLNELFVYARTQRAARRATTAQASGLTITGPQSIEPGTAYTYKVKAVTNRPYRGAALWFYSLDCSQRRVIRLVAHKAWHGNFTMSLSAPGLAADPWITASLVSPPTNRPPKVLYKAALQLTAAPTASSAPADTSIPGSGPGCEQIGS